MCVAWNKKLAQTNAAHASLVGRSAMCWHVSHWCIAEEFVGALILPAGQQFVVGAIIHAHIQAEFPGMYSKAFYAWKGNFGYASISDNGTNAFAPYPANRAWVGHFAGIESSMGRFCGTPPNGCVCCIEEGQPCRQSWPF